MSDHAIFDELAVGWALHALEPEDEAIFAVHLPGCPRCAATVAETGEVMAVLSTDLPAPETAEPGEELRTRLRAAVAATEQPPGPAVAAAPRSADEEGSPAAAPPVPAPGRRPGWRRALPGALVAAAVATILGLGLWNVVLAESRDELRATVAEQDQVVTALLRPGRVTVATLDTLDGQGEPVATVVARSGELQLITHGLSVNRADTTSYVVWGLGGDEPQALGTFDVGRSQMDMLTVGSRATGLDGFDEYAISLEPGQEAPSRPTEVVAFGEVAS